MDSNHRRPAYETSALATTPSGFIFYMFKMKHWKREEQDNDVETCYKNTILKDDFVPWKSVSLDPQ